MRTRDDQPRRVQHSYAAVETRYLRELRRRGDGVDRPASKLAARQTRAQGTHPSAKRALIG